MVYKFFDKKSAGSGVNMHANNKIKQNHQLAEEFQKPIIKKLKKKQNSLFWIQRQYLAC